jgi:hypothetical protein
MSYVLLQCVKETGKLRVKMISSYPFIKGSNCQFPRNVRNEGMYYVVRSENIIFRKNYYSAMQKNIIVCSTFDINIVKQYIKNIETDVEKKHVPERIFGEDDGGECIICMDQPKNSIFSPCGHFISCSACANVCKSCPLCRGPIENRLNKNEIK